MEGDAQAISDSAGITRVFRTAAALAMGRRSDNRKQSRCWQCSGRFAFDGTQEKPKHLVPQIVKQDRRCRTVHTTAHRQDNSITHGEKTP